MVAMHRLSTRQDATRRVSAWEKRFAGCAVITQPALALSAIPPFDDHCELSEPLHVTILTDLYPPDRSFRVTNLL